MNSEGQTEPSFTRALLKEALPGFLHGVHLPSKLPAIHLQRAFTGAGHVCFFSFLFSLPLSFKIICIYFWVSSSDWAINLIAIDCSISRKAPKIWIAISSLGSMDIGHNFCIWCWYDISNLRHHLLKKICFLQSLLCWSNISSLSVLSKKKRKTKIMGVGTWSAVSCSGAYVIPFKLWFQECPSILYL